MRERLVGVGIGIGLCGLVAGVTAWADQPHMQSALDHLNQARNALQQAKQNKGGHRENAIDLVNRAIEQVQKGMAFAGGS
jgi:hypothetical protein